MEKIPRYVRGYVKIRLESPMPERFLSLCVQNGINICNLKHCGLYYELEVSVSDFFRLKQFLKKTGSRLHIREKHGFPFWLNRNRKRKAFFLGIAVSLFLLYLCSLFVWDIRIEGNLYYSDETIREMLKELNVKDGMLKNRLDCQSIAAAVRKEFPGIVWVSAQLEGTCLILELKENQDSYRQESDPSDLDAWNLIAQKDGTVVSMITRLGMPLVKEGQEVCAGDILVSGEVEILNNDQIVQRYDYVKADADILLRTEYAYYDEFSLTEERQVYENDSERYFFLRILGKEFSLAPEAKKNQETLRQEFPVYLTSSFCLPFSYGTITRRTYRIVDQTYEEEEALAVAQERLRQFLEQLVEEDVRILDRNVDTKVTASRCISSGNIIVLESAVSQAPVVIRTIPEEPESGS